VKILLIVAGMVLFLAVAVIDFGWFGISADEPHLFGLFALGAACEVAALLPWRR
jgi:hypothetical protein